MLTYDELRSIAVDHFFLAMNRHDKEAVLNTFAPNCVMRIPSSGFVYDGSAALSTHFNDFLGMFTTIKFSDFTATIDVIQQRIAVNFRVSLTDEEGVEDVMQNANFFSVNEDGLFDDILICTSAPVRKGFEAGSA